MGTGTCTRAASGGMPTCAAGNAGKVGDGGRYRETAGRRIGVQTGAAGSWSSLDESAAAGRAVSTVPHAGGIVPTARRRLGQENRFIVHQQKLHNRLQASKLSCRCVQQNG